MEREACRRRVVAVARQGGLEGAVAAHLDLRAEVAALEEDVQQLSAAHYAQVEAAREDRARLLIEVAGLQGQLRALPAKIRTAADFLLPAKSALIARP